LLATSSHEEDKGVKREGGYANFALICVAVILSMSPWFAPAAVISEIGDEWALTGSQLAWLTNGVQIGFVAGALAASFTNLPDIMPLNRLMGASALVAGLANAALLATTDPAFAIASRCATGFALAGIYPPAMKLVSTWFNMRRDLALATVVGALTLGTALPHLFRASAADVGWGPIILLSSAATLLAAPLFVLFGKDGPFPFARAVFDWRQTGRLARNHRLTLVTLGYLGHMWELYAMWAWLLVFMRASTVTAGLVSRRIGRSNTILVFMSLSSICALSIGFAFDGPRWLLLAIAFAWGFSIIGDSPLFSAATAEIADRDLVGTALSLQMALGFGLTVVMIWAVPIFAEGVYGWRWAFLLLAPGPLLGIGATLALKRSVAFPKGVNDFRGYDSVG
jgi:MFS family permease